jgi:hypothetical protein
MVVFKGRGWVFWRLKAALVEMRLSVPYPEMSLRQLARRETQASSKAGVYSDIFMVEHLGLEPVIKKSWFIFKGVLRLH